MSIELPSLSSQEVCLARGQNSSTWAGMFLGRLCIRKIGPPPAIAREALTLLRLGRHPFIVILLGWQEKQLILELIFGCTLDKMMGAFSSGISEASARPIFHQLSLAVQFCHLQGVAHHDLSLHNVMLTTSFPILGVKLIDFGFSTFFNPTNPLGKSCCSTECTPAFVSPEYCLETYHADPPLDVWAAGAILYFLLHGTYPFRIDLGSPTFVTELCGEEGTPAKVVSLRPELSLLVSHLLRGMLCREVATRMTMGDVIQHPWFLY